jgi:hypothetical protein
MTLGDFFELCSNNPAIVIFYFVAVPLTCLLALILSRGRGGESPWKYLYAVLIYLACVPGIFALTLNAYLFLFENLRILDTNIYTQILPIVSMIITIWLITKSTSLDNVPGFDKLAGLLTLIAVILTLMWVLDKTRLLTFTYIPFMYVILILAGLLLVGRWGLHRLRS